METALGNMDAQVIEAHLEKRREKTVWDVDALTTEQAMMAVCVDAVSGLVLLTEEKVAGERRVQEKSP